MNGSDFKAPAKSRHSAFGLSITKLDVAIVDDDESMRDFLRLVCQTLGARRVRAFGAARDAFAGMRSESPNVAFVDWMMKPVDGLTLVRRMRKVDSGALSLVPVIMMSAQATLPFVNAAAAAGAHQILAKPIIPPTVAARINNLLQDSRMFILHGDQYLIDGAPPPAPAKSGAKPATDPLDTSDVWEL